jgi:Zn-dependent peptidase ImmA (M78 family)
MATTIFQAIREAQQTAHNGPVDLDALASRLGIKIERCWLDEDMSGALIKNADGSYTIQVNALHPETRQRFTIAHEMGHFVHHRHLLGDGVNDSRAYRTDSNHKYYNARIGPKQETEANRFAASLLMPGDVVNEMVKIGMPVSAMAEHLGVSRHAMSIRAGVPYEG